MKNLSFEETKKVEIEILKTFADFCDENNLTYFLAYGTLIGAVRHKGFIPWDDDIDVWMPRQDYKKLQEIFNCKNTEGNCIAILPTEKISRHPFVKIVDKRTVKKERGIDYKNGTIGVDIDVFPLDGEPDDDNVFEKWYNDLQKLYKAHLILVSKCPEETLPKIKHIIKQIIVRVICKTKSRILKKTAKLHSKYSYVDSNYVGTVESCFNFKNNRYKKEWFSESVLTDFEEYQFKVPVGYHEILTQMYGNYMQLPPVEKRVTHHTNNTFWKENDDEKV